MKPLTEQQASIKQWADRGYPSTEIGRVLGLRPALVSDQVGLIRKKGHAIRLVSATEYRRALNRGEAERIAREAK